MGKNDRRAFEPVPRPTRRSTWLALGAMLLLTSGNCRNRGEPTNEVDLLALTVSEGELSPPFHELATAYTVDVGSLADEMTVTATTEARRATLEIDGQAATSGVPFGPIALAPGGNVITIVVHGFDGITDQTTTIAVERSPATAELAALSLSAGTLTPAFDPAITSYTVAVPGTTTSTTLSATLADPDATLLIDGTSVPSGQASAPIALAVGDNPIEVVVTPTSGSIRTTEVVVSRAALFGIAQHALIEAPDEGVRGFGAALALAGNTLAVAARREDGSALARASSDADGAGSCGVVLLYERADEQWTLAAELCDPSERFGASLALSDGALAVGAPGDARGGSSSAVHLFTRAEEAWSRRAVLAPPRAGERFGASVALDEETLVVGAPAAAGGVGRSREAPGASVYVFARARDGWSDPARLAATGASPSFGTRVALSGAILAVAEPSPHLDGGADRRAGVVHVFVREDGAWRREARLELHGDDAGFGASLGLARDMLAVGAASGAGAVHLFQRTGGTWSHAARIEASNGEGPRGRDPGDRFGAALALDGERLLVAAPDEDGAASGIDGDEWNELAPSAGAAYAFLRRGASWSQAAYVKTASDVRAGDRFAAAIAADRGTFACSLRAEGASGAVCVFR